MKSASTPPPSSPPSPPTVIICPGNGCGNIRRSNWYGLLHDKLVNDHNIECVCENFPDPLHARREKWVPHMRAVAEKHGADSDPDNVVLIGHSSGAQASLRYAELYPVRGVVLEDNVAIAARLAPPHACTKSYLTSTNPQTAVPTHHSPPIHEIL
ncbi:hypothetical protein THAOC_14517 [Thalassiosira oceanica]|uniref:AB hydrolase-1 domain-containing protein n=1 Tax=Thalassiosira oceanica TaxID=159749 RepID=K0SF58_THAOC|nr:hypothetical protein THAOC_14517 [Thalassiosira oceanica]|eukprot:EJK64718.1 hypothetical protein THAOC_14517 [Thalassiosira oceanica]